MDYSKQHREKKYIIEGINAIMKKAEADTGLSGWNKLRIINECRAALFDLYI